MLSGSFVEIWQQGLWVMKVATEISEREGLHRVKVSDDAIWFALLAPGIVRAALDGPLPRTMSLGTLQRRTMPLDWAEQRGW